MNPCRCGYLGDAGLACARAPKCAGDYQAKVSGPLLDRIDLHVEVQAVSAADLMLPPPSEGSAEVAVIPLGLNGFDRIEAVHRLLSALHGRAIPPDTRLTRQQRARLRKMLQAIDGDRDGATQQEIAQVLFNIGHLDRDEWQASSARHGVKALLRDARAMIAGGYKKLLRHRRR